MKRWLIRTCVLLLLGAIVNVAVSVACAYRIADLPRVYIRTCIVDIERTAIWNAHRQSGWPDAPPVCHSQNLRGENLLTYAAMRDEYRGATNTDLLVGSSSPWVTGRPMMRPVTSHSWTIIERQSGWPCLSFDGAEWRHAETVHAPNGTRSTASQWGTRCLWHVEVGMLPTNLLTPAGTPDARLIPLRPIWLGFAINTVFYSVVLWLLFAGPFVLRRWRRIRRGLCPKCAYDLRGSPQSGGACPECGSIVAS